MLETGQFRDYPNALFSSKELGRKNNNIMVS